MDTKAATELEDEIEYSNTTKTKDVSIVKQDKPSLPKQSVVPHPSASPTDLPIPSLTAPSLHQHMSVPMQPTNPDTFHMHHYLSYHTLLTLFHSDKMASEKVVAPSFAKSDA
jgi:lipopolysaccharide export LptBFGC system permease protein LptF